MASDPVMLPTAADLWRHAIEALPETIPPCRHLSPSRWSEMRAACLDFLDRFGSEAVRLGWTAPELFGVHPENGTLRTDWCGALMLGTERASAIEATRVVFARTAAYRGRPGQPVGVPVWEYAARRSATAA